MSGADIQSFATFFSLLKLLSGNDTIVVAFFMCSTAVVIVPSLLAYKAIKILAGQIGPLRDEITASSKSFSELITEIRTQRSENHKMMVAQDSLVKTVIDLVERVTRRLTQLESSTGKNGK